MSIEQSLYLLSIECDCGNGWSSYFDGYQTRDECVSAAQREGWAFLLTLPAEVLCPACASEAP